MIRDDTVVGKGGNLLRKKDLSSSQDNAQQIASDCGYLRLLDELPVFSEAAILLEEGTVESSYIRTAEDGTKFFGFEKYLPGTKEYQEIVARHKLVIAMEANTFEQFPSGKTVLSMRGKVIEINFPEKMEY
jgi:hypothetical protein